MKLDNVLNGRLWHALGNLVCASNTYHIGPSIPLSTILGQPFNYFNHSRFALDVAAGWWMVGRGSCTEKFVSLRTQAAVNYDLLGTDTDFKEMGG